MQQAEAEIKQEAFIVQQAFINEVLVHAEIIASYE